MPSLTGYTQDATSVLALSLYHADPAGADLIEILHITEGRDPDMRDMAAASRMVIPSGQLS